MRRPLTVAGLVGCAWAAACSATRPERVATPRADALSLRGGLVMELALGSSDPTVRARAIAILERRLAAFGDVSVEPSGELARVTVTGVSPDRADAAQAAVTIGGRVELAPVLEHASLIDAQLALLDAPNFALQRDVDVWTPADGGSRHAVPFLRSHDRAPLERAIARLPAASGERVVLERSIGSDPPPSWRTYVIASHPWQINRDVVRATTSWDPDMNQPVVRVDFDDDGRRRFAELTAAHVGEKLAFLVDGVVTSAPIVATPIRGGSAIITIGGVDRAQMLRDADALVSALEAGAPLPVPVVVRSVHVVPPPTCPSRATCAGPAGRDSRTT